MQVIRHGSFALLIGIFLSAGTHPTAAEELDMGHVREELGVNNYTAPPVSDVLQLLGLMTPIPYAKAKRDVPGQSFTFRPQLAMNFGGLVADAFLLVGAEKQGNAEVVARALLKEAKALAISKSVTRHAESLSHLVAKEDWNALKQELVLMQDDIEKALMELKDEEIAHLIAFGGWTRGLEVAAVIANDNYTPAKAARIIQPELLDYFTDRLSTLEPTLAASPLFKDSLADLQKVSAIVKSADGGTLSPEQVKEILAIAQRMNARIITPVE